MRVLSTPYRLNDSVDGNIANLRSLGGTPCGFDPHPPYQTCARFTSQVSGLKIFRLARCEIFRKEISQYDAVSSLILSRI
jgi:hypothetical protein